MRFLRSRYAISVTHGQANDIILGLGGGMLSADVRKGVAGLVAAKQKQKRQQKLDQASFGNTPGIEESSAGMAIQEETDDASPSSAAKISYHERCKNVNASRNEKRQGGLRARQLLESRRSLHSNTRGRIRSEERL